MNKRIFMSLFAVSALSCAANATAPAPQELDRQNGLIPAPLVASDSGKAKAIKPRIPAPIGNFSHWVTDEDYPTAALREERQGTVLFNVTVNAEGKVAKCEITSSSGSPDLDSAACNLWTERGSFRPALNSRGKPIVSKFPGRVRWTLPV